MAHDESSCDREFLCLSDLSNRDITWKVVKPQSQMIANAYAGTAYDKYFERMSSCGGWLRFALVPTESGEVVHKLQSAHFCHVRHCPICQWRRSLMWRARVFRVMPRIIADYLGKRFVYLTLTVRNCEIDQLGETLTHMSESWQRLSQRKQFPALGWLRTTEVTRGKDGTAHPHFHALLMVNSNYFKKHYISQKKWIELWRESLRVEYDPSVRVNVVKPRSKPNTDTSVSKSDSDCQSTIQPLDEELVKAIRYTLKYSTKPDDFLSLDTSVSQDLSEFQDWLVSVTDQLHKRRMIALGGAFKKYMSEVESSNLIVDDASTDTSETQDEDIRITYVWRDEVVDYLMAA